MQVDKLNNIVSINQYAESNFKAAYLKNCVEQVAEDLACFLDSAGYSHSDITTAIDEFYFTANFCSKSLSSAIDDICDAAPAKSSQEQNINAYMMYKVRVREYQHNRLLAIAWVFNDKASYDDVKCSQICDLIGIDCDKLKAYLSAKVSNDERIIANTYYDLDEREQKSIVKSYTNHKAELAYA